MASLIHADLSLSAIIEYYKEFNYLIKIHQ
jgi:hypothetical protein